MLVTIIFLNLQLFSILENYPCCHKHTFCIQRYQFDSKSLSRKAILVKKNVKEMNNVFLSPYRRMSHLLDCLIKKWVTFFIIFLWVTDFFSTFLFARVTLLNKMMVLTHRQECYGTFLNKFLESKWYLCGDIANFLEQWI